MYGLVEVSGWLQVCYFATSSSGCLLSLDCSVVHGRLTLRIMTIQNPVNPSKTPCTWWYRGIFSILCYLLKNSLTEPESCIYQAFTSLTVTSKNSYFSMSCNHPIYRELTSLFTVNSVTLTVTSKSSYFSNGCNHPIYKTVQYLHRETSEALLTAPLIGRRAITPEREAPFLISLLTSLYKPCSR